MHGDPLRLAALRRRLALPIFVILAFGVPWIGWIAIKWIKSPTPFEMLLVTFWFPASCSLAGFVAAAVEGGFSGLKTFTARVCNLRFKPWLWLIALLVPVAAAGATFIFHPADLLGKGSPNLALILTAFTFAGTGMGPIAEEFGWRGYLLDRLRRKGCTPLVASLAIGPVWAAWHIPLYYDTTFAHVGAACLFVIWATAWSVVFGLIVARARGSVWPAIIGHWALNNQAIFYIALLPGLSQNRMPGGYPFWLTAIAAAILLAWFWRKLQWCPQPDAHTQY
jgi:membrane protease YdiL (CAAX protease family)